MPNGLVIIFDLGDVLWDECLAVRRIADSALGYLREKRGICKTWKDWKEAYIRAAYSGESGSRTSLTVHYLTGDAGLAYEILGSLRSSVKEMTVQEFSSLHPLRDDAHLILMHLSQSHQLGILSNQPRISRALLDFYGLPIYFRRIFISDEVGMKKPDTRLFQMAVHSWNVGPDRVVMVGNRLDNDIAPAKVCGFRTVLYKCPNALVDERLVDPETKPDAVVGSLRELQQAISKIIY